VVVTGTSPSHHSFNYLTIAYDAATGGQEWASTYDHAGKLADGAAGLAMAPDGSAVFVTGSSETANRDDDYSTVAYDAASGAQRWVAGYDGPGHGQDDASAVATGGGGSRVFVTGWSVGGDGSLDYATLAYRTSDGTELWRARLNGSAKSDDYATALAVSPNRTQVYVTGETTSTAGDGDYTTVAYATGAQPPARMR
jgi:hypothetical protein